MVDVFIVMLLSYIPTKLKGLLVYQRVIFLKNGDWRLDLPQPKPYMLLNYYIFLHLP